jgi:GGDEF domain-containing protein
LEILLVAAPLKNGGTLTGFLAFIDTPDAFLEETSDIIKYEAGDRLIKKAFHVLADVFSSENVYRIGGAEFAVFGHESDEIIFNADVDRVRNLMDELDISVSIGSVYCAFGTMDINKVIKHVNKLLRDKIS